VSARDEEIIARLRGAHEAFNRGDFEAATEIAHPEIEVVRLAGQPVLRGVDALRAWMQPDAFEDQQMEASEFTVMGNKVLVRQRSTARGAGSGIEVDVDFWTVWTMNDDGLVTRLALYLDEEKADALEEAGLRE
jgi:hypothetical protein